MTICSRVRMAITQAGNMLKKIFKAGGKVLIMMMLGLLILSFALWGVGDVLRGNTNTAVAVIDGEEISEQALRSRLQKEISYMRNYFGNAINDEVIQSLGLEKKALRDLVNETLLRQETDRLGIILGDKVAVKEIASNESFRATNGEFNAQAFKQFLNNQKESEASYTYKLKKALARQLLMDSLTAAPIIPDEIAEMVYKYENEQRKLSLLKIPFNMIQSVGSPDESELIEYFDREKTKFAAPEYREVTYIVLDKKTAKAEEQITEDDLKQAYEDRLYEFTTPEKRRILHINFDDEETAKQAKTELVAGKDFLQIAKEKVGQDEEDTKFGEVTKAELLKEIGEVAFALSEGGTSDPVESDLGWHIVKVEEIIIAKQKPYSKVKAGLRKDLIENSSEEIIYSLSTQLEDALAGGTTLEEAGREIGVKVKKIETINEEGKTQIGREVANIPSDESFLTTIFATMEGTESELMRNDKDSGYFVVRVDSVTMSRIKALDEVKGLVISKWKEDKKQELLTGLAKQAADLAKGGEKLASIKAQIAKGNEATKKYKAVIVGLAKVEKANPITRTPKVGEGELPAGLVGEAFTLKRGESSVYYQTVDNSFVVGLLDEIIPAQESAEKIKATQKNLAFDFADDIWEQYLNYLRLNYSIKLYEKNVQ